MPGSEAGLWSELPFRLRRPLGILTGAIDKLLITKSSDDEGFDIEIIDFKTNRARRLPVSVLPASFRVVSPGKVINAIPGFAKSQLPDSVAAWDIYTATGSGLNDPSGLLVCAVAEKGDRNNEDDKVGEDKSMVCGLAIGVVLAIGLGMLW